MLKDKQMQIGWFTLKKKVYHGYLHTLGSNLVTWKSMKQVVAKSGTETKYQACNDSGKVLTTSALLL